MSQPGTPDNPLLRGAREGRRSAFTLVELLVVTAIIALLIAISVPSARRGIRQARSTVCKSNLKNLHHALVMYQDENHGWLPTGDAVSAFRANSTWSTKLFRDDPAGRGVLICPDDPWGPIIRNNMTLYGLAVGENSSYGLNDFIVSSPDSFLANLGRYHPARPDDTILLADMGPDRLMSPPEDPNSLVLPSRNFGRLAIDDGYRPGDPPEQESEPWLTARHCGRINVLTLAGNVKDVATIPVLVRTIDSYYPDCAAQSCTICVDLELPHYSFAESHVFWWTGPSPVR